MPNNLSSASPQLNSPTRNYGDEFNAHLLEQYKLYVEMADRVSSRRIQITTFYTSILSGLLALLSVTADSKIIKEYQGIVVLLFSILGLCLCLAWIININSYRQLNSLKFRVIHEMEKYLPFSCYEREWEFLNIERSKNKYTRLSNIEKYIPLLMALPYVCLLIISILSFIQN